MSAHLRWYAGVVSETKTPEGEAVRYIGVGDELGVGADVMVTTTAEWKAFLDDTLRAMEAGRQGVAAACGALEAVLGYQAPMEETVEQVLAREAAGTDGLSHQAEAQGLLEVLAKVLGRKVPGT
jgi:hypothetical protein